MAPSPAGVCENSRASVAHRTRKLLFFPTMSLVEDADGLERKGDPGTTSFIVAGCASNIQFHPGFVKKASLPSLAPTSCSTIVSQLAISIAVPLLDLRSPVFFRRWAKGL